MQEDMEADEMDSTSTITAARTSARTAKTKWDTLCDAGLLIVCAVMDHLTCDAYTAVKTMCNKFVKECGVASAEPTYEDLCTESNLRDILSSERVFRWTKATVGGVPPFSLMCWSHSHEWLCTLRMKMVWALVLAQLRSPLHCGLISSM